MQHSSPSLSPSQPTAYLESSVTTRGAHTLGQAGVPQDPADHKLDAAEPRQSVLGWAMSKLGHTLCRDCLLIPITKKANKSTGNSGAKVVVGVNAGFAAEMRMHKVERLLRKQNLQSPSWHKALPVYKAYVDDGEGSLENVVDAIAAEAQHRKQAEARWKQVKAAAVQAGVDLDLLDLRVCQDFVQRDVGSLEAVVALLHDVTDERAWRVWQVDQLLAESGLARFSRLKTVSGKVSAQLCQ
ncbi:hypothetical protein WJX72_009396 [[Myrmecia] bisecta]|uniref:Uncharacterized protein n=1 Tax=[Myrmecia] bisecta TaxID=41462 RepID=A0AAW1PGS7_9CHLO